MGGIHQVEFRSKMSSLGPLAPRGSYMSSSNVRYGVINGPQDPETPLPFFPQQQPLARALGRSVFVPAAEVEAIRSPRRRERAALAAQ